jgi:hypothetical protein
MHDDDSVHMMNIAVWLREELRVGGVAILRNPTTGEYRILAMDPSSGAFLISELQPTL